MRSHVGVTVDTDWKNISKLPSELFLARAHSLTLKIFRVRVDREV